MTIFKNYFKIISKHKFAVLIYTFVFVGLMAIFSTIGSNSSQEYSSVNVATYIENRSDSQIGQGLVDYLDDQLSIVDIRESDIDDELFYGTIDAYILIPEDFDENRLVHFKSSPDAMYAMLGQQAVNDFLGKVSAYEDSGYSLDQAISNANEDLSTDIDMTLLSGSSNQDSQSALTFFNFLSYVFMAQIMLVVTLVMTVYNKEIISKRNEVSPIKKSWQNLQLIMGHWVTGFVVWLVYMILFAIVSFKLLSLRPVLYMILNSFVFAMVIVSFAMLISRIIKKEEAIAGVLNVFTLGSSFLSGAFVPQELLSETTLTIAKFFPTYYYISNNVELNNGGSITDILPNLLIMIGFGIGFILLTIIVKPKSRKN